MTIWEPGDSTEILVETLKQYIIKWINEPEYLSRQPDEHVFVQEQGDKQSAGVYVIIVTQKEDKPAWPYTPDAGEYAGRPIVEEFHSVGLFVKADQKNGGVQSVNRMHSLLKTLFFLPENHPEKRELIDLGICNVFENNGEVVIDPDQDDTEGTFFRKRLDLSCSTEILLK